MQTQHTYIPVESLNSFVKFADKTKSNVDGFNYDLVGPKNVLFHHPVIDEDGHHCGLQKVFHEVYELNITYPEKSDWKLVCSYKDGLFFPTDSSKEIMFKNKEHGASYYKCDICGHWIINSYVIENIITGEELQVGRECLKKFGIECFDFLSKFDRELYKIYDYTRGYYTGDEPPVWGGKLTSPYKSAITKSQMIAICKAQYDKCPVFFKGRKVDGCYQKSKTVEEMTKMIFNDIDVDQEYVNKVCEFCIKNNKMSSDFEIGMVDVAKNYYVCGDQFAFAFFMVKNYEESLKKNNFKKGDAIKVTGEVIDKDYKETIYGLVKITTILTPNGNVCEKTGVVPTFEKDGKTCVDFYTTIKNTYCGKIYLDRIVKNPKKGVTYIAC